MRICRLFVLILLSPALLPAQVAERLPEGVNTEYEEREPVPTHDGRGLYLWRRQTAENVGGEFDPGDIWYTYRDRNGQWVPAVHLPAPLNGLGHDFVWHVSRFHDTLWLNQNPPGVAMAAPAYSVKLGPDRWSSPQRVQIRGLDYKGQYKDYFMGPGRLLFIPNEGDDSYGGTDLYVCFPINDTTWGPPVNLGPDINTPGDEDAPRLSADGRTLYFNSNGHGGLGDHDVFSARRLDDTWRRWSRPENAGPPINTIGYDFDFCISRDGSTAFWGSAAKSLGINDIFSLDLRSCDVTVYPRGDRTVCEGTVLELQGGFATGSDLRYQWLKDGQPLTGATDRILRVAVSGRYQLVRSSNGCRDTSEAQSIRFVSPPIAHIDAASTVICLDDSVALRATLTEARVYQWQLNGRDIPGATGPLYWARRPGEYRVRVADGDCFNTSASVQIQRFSPPGLYTDRDTSGGRRPTLPDWRWTNKLPPQKGEVLIRDIATGPQGNVYVLSSVLRGRRVSDYLVEFGPEGLYRYTFPVERHDSPDPRHLVADIDGNLLLLDPSRYLTKYRPDGTVMWSKAEARNGLLGLATDPLGYIYTAGRFDDTLRLGTRPIPAANRGGVFLAKYSPRGELLWVRTFPVDAYKYDFGNALHTDCMGQVYLAGGFKLIANFGDEVLRAGMLGENYFVAKFSPEGDYIWGRVLNTPKARERSADAHTDCQGNTFLLLNREIFHLDANGAKRWTGELLEPDGATTLRSRLTSYREDVYIAGFTDRGDSYVTKLNRLHRQTIIWQDRGAAHEAGHLPAIHADEAGSILVAGNSTGSGFAGDQFDLTSGSAAFVMKYGKPGFEYRRSAIELCRGETLSLFTREEKGLSYQWMRNGKELAGQTNPILDVRGPGLYQLRISAGVCMRLSEPQEVGVCPGEPAPDGPPVVAVTEPAQPDPQPAGDLKTSAGGKPRSLRGRPIKQQEAVVVSRPQGTLYIWDNAAEDRDTISVNVNGTWLLQEYGLKNEKLVLEYTFRPGDNYIVLFAHNLGGVPPNTAAITVDDGVRRQTMELRSTLRNCGTLRVRLE
ncbi:MAG: hypothetical protein OHK0039_37840 [Bacteroidia bacterium]